MIPSAPMRTTLSIRRRVPVLALAALACGSLIGAAAPAKAPAAHQGVLPFIADDYAKALQTARARKLPIFVESWAPW